MRRMKARGVEPDMYSLSEGSLEDELSRFMKRKRPYVRLWRLGAELCEGERHLWSCRLKIRQRRE